MLWTYVNLSIIVGYDDSMILPENSYLLIQQAELKERNLCSKNKE